jgi:hypothetical protein
MKGPAESSAPHAHPSIEEQDDTVEAHYACLERPCACTDGLVYIGHLVDDPVPVKRPRS